MKLLPIVLLFLSFSAFAYDNPYTNQRNWEARERFENPQNFSDGRDAYHFQRQHDRYERDMRRDAEIEAHRDNLEREIERSRYRY